MSRVVQQELKDIETTETAIARGAVSSSTRSKKTHHHSLAHQHHRLYSATGGHDTMHVPLPFASAATSAMGLRYLTVRASSVNVITSLAAGEVALIVCDPTRLKNPLKTFVTTTAGTVGYPVTSLSFTPATTLNDFDYTGTVVNGDWSGHCPYDLFINQDCVKNAGLGQVKVATYDDHPPKCQPLHTDMLLQVTVPREGQCVTYAYSPGNNKNLHGQTSEHVRLGANIAPAVVTRFMSRDDTAACPLIIGANTTSFLGLAQKLCTPIIQTGATNQASIHYAINGAPQHGWCHAGELDVTDAPGPNSVVSENNLIKPRNNHTWYANGGFLVVQNTGTVAVTIAGYLNVTTAIVLEVDDESRTVSAIASIMRQQADRLNEHSRHPDHEAFAVTTGPSLGSAMGARHEIAGISGPTDVSKKIVPTVHHNSVVGALEKGMHVVKTFVGDAASFVGGHLKSAASKLWGDVKSTATTAAKDVLDVITAGLF